MKSSLIPLRNRHHLRKTFHNLRITLFCGLLTFIVLRSSLGAGKFGTPAKDYDEIRHHLQTFRLRQQQKLLVRKELAAATATSRQDASRRSTLSLATLPSEAGALNYGGEGFRAGKRSHFSISPRVMLVTGSQLANCESAVEAQFLLKLLKNKMDYCALHGMDIFFDTETDVESAAAHGRLLRKLLVSQPQVEWFWWMDSTSMFTDMSNTLAYEMYSAHNVVVFSSDSVMDGIKRSVLVRNSEQALEFLADMERGIQMTAIDLMVDMEMKTKLYGRDHVGVGNVWPFITVFESCKVCSKGIDPSCLREIERAFIFADGQHGQAAPM